MTPMSAMKPEHKVGIVAILAAAALLGGAIFAGFTCEKDKRAALNECVAKTGKVAECSLSIGARQ